MSLAPETQALMDAHESPFVLVDGEYRIVAANRAYCEVYGVGRSEVVGRYCYAVSHHLTVPCHEEGEDCPLRRVIETGKPREVRHVHYDRLNQPERVRISGIPVPSQGRLLVGEIIYREMASSDITCDDLHMVGRSPAFLTCADNLARVAESEAPILLYGESGVGKELAAQFVHKRSSRANRPFMAINCASIPDTLFESELFGHEKGAFTGSVGRKLGLFELANDGTLFLDEVGEIPLAMQAKLLRVLETGEFRRVGGKDLLKSDVRVVSATNRDLLEMVDRGTFRQDLYYRLAGIDVTLPPLRERRLDIPALAEMFLLRIGAESRKHYFLTDEAIARLVEYNYPGNVRELRNILQKAAVLSKDGIIGAAQIPLESAASRTPSRPAPASARSMAEIEAHHIAELLQQHNGHRRRVAEILGISERTLYRKLHQHGLHGAG